MIGNPNFEALARRIARPVSIGGRSLGPLRNREPSAITGRALQVPADATSQVRRPAGQMADAAVSSIVTTAKAIQRHLARLLAPSRHPQ
jgi:hypothetical protein